MSSPNPHPGFWGDSSVRTGRVRRLSATSFADLATRYLCVPVQFPLTRKEFWSLNPKERDLRKDGPFICSCGFIGDQESQRNDASATKLVLVTLDLDSGEFLKEMAAHPQTISESLFPYNHVVYHTAKSTPEAPRLKVMVEVDPCSPTYLKRFVSRVAALIGVPKDFQGSKESSVISQAQYRGIQFKGDSQPVAIASKIDGIPMHVSDLPEIEPDEEELLLGRTYADQGDDEDDFYGLAFLPVAGLKVEDIREALDKICPDVERPIWLSVAAALKHQFGDDEDTAQEAYEAFVSWSEKGSKFAGRKDTYTVWKSLRSRIKGRPPVTIRSLYKHATDAGWDSGRVARKLAQTIEEWFAEVSCVNVLMTEGATRIASMPFANAIVEEALVNKWRARLTALGGTNIDKSTLKSELVRVRKADKKAKQDTRGDALPAWLRPYVYVASVDGFYNMGNGSIMKTAAFNNFFAKELMPEETPANSRPVAEPKDYALNTAKILRVEDLMYDPSQSSDEPIFICAETGKLMLNSYNFSSPPIPDPEFADRAEALIRGHAAVLIKEPHLQEMLLDYLSLQVKFPARKIPWSFLIQSAPGVGKGTLGEIMEAVLGSVNVKVISSEMMSAPFNEWSQELVFGIFNEVHIPGERRDQVMNKLKAIISDSTIALSLKHRDGNCRARNPGNYIGFTNYKDATHLSIDDRRWAIIFSPLQSRSQVEELQKSGHFIKLRWLTTPEGASALRYFFMKKVISPDFPLNGPAPNTKYKEEVVSQSKNALQVFVEDLIDDGEYPLISDLAIHDGALKDLIRNPRDHAFVARYLSLMGFERYDSKRYMVNAVRGHIWIRTEKWDRSVDPVRFLKKRLKDVPELDADPEFE